MGLRSKREPGYRYLTPEEADTLDYLECEGLQYRAHTFADEESWVDCEYPSAGYTPVLEMPVTFPGHYHTADYWRIKVCDTES